MYIKVTAKNVTSATQNRKFCSGLNLLVCKFDIQCTKYKYNAAVKNIVKYFVNGLVAMITNSTTQHHLPFADKNPTKANGVRATMHVMDYLHACNWMNFARTMIGWSVTYQTSHTTLF